VTIVLDRLQVDPYSASVRMAFLVRVGPNIRSASRIGREELEATSRAWIWGTAAGKFFQSKNSLGVV